MPAIFVLDLGCAVDRRQASGWFLAGTLDEPEPSRNNKMALGSSAGAFHVPCSQPALAAGVGNIFCVKCLVSYEDSASELKNLLTAFTFFFLYKESQPKFPRPRFCADGRGPVCHRLTHARTHQEKEITHPGQ